MKKRLLFILLTFITVLATPYPVSSSSENYKISLFEETVTVLDDLSIHVHLNFAFIPLIEEGYYFDTWYKNIHTADADRISVENEYGPLQFESAVEGTWTLLTIDLGRRVYANETYLLKIGYYADDRITITGPEKSLRMWMVTDDVYKENVTLIVNIPQSYGIVEYEPSFLSSRQSADGTTLSGQMLGISAEEQYYLDVMFADTVVQYNITYTYTFTNEGLTTEDVFDFEVLGPLDMGLQEVMQIYCTPTPVSISYDESGNPRYKFTIGSVASGGQTTLTINILIKIRLPSDYNESSSVQMDQIPSNLLIYTTADEYWEVDNPTIYSLSMNLTEGRTGVLNKARAIYNFIIENIEYDDTKYEQIVSGENTERYGAIGTYIMGRGVCGDFADLFVTLCRASGIPASVVEGFIYYGDGLQDIGHAWAEIFIPEYGWLQVDPTWELFGILEGRHISESLRRDSSNTMEILWWAHEPFSLEMNTDISLLTTEEIYVPARTCELALFEDWNFISFPLTPQDASIEVVLADVLDTVESVWTFNGETQTWSSYSPGAPSVLSEMVGDRGYWIKVTDDTTLTVNGESANTSVLTLFEGWNLIGLPLTPMDPSIGVVLTDILDNVNFVWTFDGETKAWSSYSPGAPSNLVDMVDDRGYWIKVTESATLTVHG